MPILPALDPGLTGTSLSGPSGGLMLWLAFGLIGSLRVLPIPGSSAVWTFHFPFIAAAMVLGGPTAGAWVGFLATLERREIETRPWYGTLANHAVLALGAVVGGLTVLVLEGALAASDVDPGAARVIAIAAGTLVLAVTANGMAAGTIMLRERLAPIAVVDILVRSIGRITLAEIGLACVFTVAYVFVGWWAPLALAIFVLLVWPGEGVEFIDPLMGLPRMAQFHRELDGVVSRCRRGLAPGGLLLSIDLIHFGEINKDPNLGKEVGDEVLREIGVRLRALVRTTDILGRLGGDELAMFYAGVVDRKTAFAIARRVSVAVGVPIVTSRGEVRVGASIGGLIVRPSPDLPSREVLMDWADRTMQEHKVRQKAERTNDPMRLHPYGASGAAAEGGEAADARPRAARRDRAMVGALLVAGTAFVAAVAAWVVRLLA